MPVPNGTASTSTLHLEGFCLLTQHRLTCSKPTCCRLPGILSKHFPLLFPFFNNNILKTSRTEKKKKNHLPCSGLFILNGFVPE